MTGMVIVGAGECGTRAAFALREAAYDGPVTLIGAEPHIPYERPPLTKHAGEEVALKPIADPQRLADNKIDYRACTTVTAIDHAASRITLADGTHLPYAKLLLATGARPRTLPGATAAKVMRTYDDAQAIYAAPPGARVVIIGAGLIGLELAATLRQHDAQVTVIEAAPAAMQRAVLPAIADILVARHRDNGVAIEFSALVDTIGQDTVTLTDGRTFPADMVVVAIGITPTIDLAAGAGLAVDNGIVVDANLRTADPDIYAAGDCCNFPLPDGRRVRSESWRTAQQHGAAAARNMLGHNEPYTAVPWFWSDQYDLGLQVAGLTDPQGETLRRDLSPEAFVLFQLNPDGTLQSASGLGPGRIIAKDVRLAEMIIERGVQPSPADLTNPTVNLKKLARG